ncbi:MAG: hypothetical protein PHH70_03205, partial [Candidatus Gracilibacteria bacterium]|nr:hypothetical protein [Candidatus Gracilibacteria bacterium]
PTIAKDFAGNTVSNLGSNDGFVAKLSGTDGSQSWFKTFGGTGSDYPMGVESDSDGNIYAGGFYSTGAKDFAGNTVPNAGSYDGFVAKLSSVNGLQSWFKRFGGTGSDSLDFPAVTVDFNGNLYLIGDYLNDNNPLNTNGARDFAGNPLLGNSPNPTSSTVLIEKL